MAETTPVSSKEKRRPHLIRVRVRVRVRVGVGVRVRVRVRARETRRGAQLEGAPDGGRPYNSFGREVVERLLP